MAKDKRDEPVQLERPTEGGSYTRQPDGSLKRNSPTPAAPEVEQPADPEPDEG